MIVVSVDRKWRIKSEIKSMATKGCPKDNNHNIGNQNKMKMAIVAGPLLKARAKKLPVQQNFPSLPLH